MSIPVSRFDLFFANFANKHIILIVDIPLATIDILADTILIYT